jgi:hypothetical protein
MIINYPISYAVSDYFTNYIMYNYDVDLNLGLHRNLVQYCSPFHVDWLLSHYDKVMNYMEKDGVKSVIDFGCGMGGFAWLGRDRFDEIISVDRTDAFKPLMDSFETKLDFMCNRIQRKDFKIKNWDRKDKLDAMALIRFYPIEMERDKEVVKDYIAKLKHYANTIYIHSIDNKSSRHLDKMGYRLNKYMWKI